MAVGRGRLAIAVTVVAWLSYVVPAIWNEFVRPEGRSLGSALEAFVYLGLTSLLAFSATAYLLARHGAFVRNSRHRRAPRGLIDAAMRDRGHRNLTVLVPSYKEDARVIRQTLLSAALQEYPSKRIVLLIDDPSTPDTPAAARLLDEARAVPGEIAEMLKEPAADFAAALEKYCSQPWGGPAEVLACAALYRRAARYVDDMRSNYRVVDHTDRFCRDEVLGRLQRDIGDAASALEVAGNEGQELSEAVMLQMHNRLAWTFACEMTSFERKRYVNLSHDANKAMNLNAYIGLMGGSYRYEQADHLEALVECDPDEADLVIPNPDYILTLDADSVLLPEYCLRLTHRLEQPAFADVAVIQTPYSAYPGAATRIERTAGATTDLQHVLHQGMTYYDATFWVGANAILRREALDDILEVDNTGHWPVKRYISDRTVIEDTESSIDLISTGWRLHNYNERLSYSATPPDFGSLCIQRQRWANGGLLIAPKLRAVVRRGADHVGLMLRLNYMASIAWSSVGLLVLLVWPFDDRLLSPLVVAIAAPYFLAMASDLKRSGYKRSDVIRIYAFNLLMLPVNLVGSVKSIYQAVTGRKNSFVRTPKVVKRTTAGFTYVLFPYVLIVVASLTTYSDLTRGAWGHAVFAGINAVLGLYGLVAFIGIRNSLLDMVVRAFDAVRHDVHTDDGEDPQPGWEERLFYGSDGIDSPPRARIPAGLARSRPEHFVPHEERSAYRRSEAMPSRLSGSAAAGGSVNDPEGHRPDTDLIDAVRASRELLVAIEARLEQGEGQEHVVEAIGPNSGRGQ